MPKQKLYLRKSVFLLKRESGSLQVSSCPLNQNKLPSQSQASLQRRQLNMVKSLLALEVETGFFLVQNWLIIPFQGSWFNIGHSVCIVMEIQVASIINLRLYLEHLYASLNIWNGFPNYPCWIVNPKIHVNTPTPKPVNVDSSVKSFFVPVINPRTCR